MTRLLIDDVPYFVVDQINVGAVQWPQIGLTELLPAQKVVQCCVSSVKGAEKN